MILSCHHAPRLLEITGAKEPSALESLVKGLGIKLESVSRCEEVT